MLGYCKHDFQKVLKGRPTHFLASPAVVPARYPFRGCGFFSDAPCGSRGAVNLVPACRQTVLLGFWEALQPQGVIVPVP